MTGSDVTSPPALPDLRVVGAGFGRTGTASFQAALTLLGLSPCDHMHENFTHPERFELWRAALQAKDAGAPIDWEPLLAGYRAVVDWPSAYFWRELADANPQAKVVLTTRDSERWYASFHATIVPFLEQLTETGGETLPSEIILERTFSGRARDRAYALAVFADHLQAVRATIAPDRLLVFDIAEGWEPLCAFLEVPVPEGVPFPRLNTTTEFQAEVQKHLA